jgi:predicted lipid-binding transport protein (Tim44 family)
MPLFPSSFAAPLVAAVLLLSSPALAASGHWQAQADGVNRALSAAEASFAKGEIDTAKRAVTTAYFQDFEDSKMEAAIRKHVSAKRATEIEKLFAALRKAMTAGDAAQVTAAAAELRGAISGEAQRLDAAQVPAEVFEVNQ